MMSKKRLLKEIDLQIENHGYGITDFELSDAPSPAKGEALKTMIADLKELKEIRKKLEDLLL